MRKTGKTKWFDKRKGFGFITSDDGEDVFVHYSQLKDVEELEEGQSVEFDLIADPKGDRADNVVLV